MSQYCSGCDAKAQCPAGSLPRNWRHVEDGGRHGRLLCESCADKQLLAEPRAEIAADAAAKLEEAVRARLKIETARLDIQLRTQSEAFVRRAQGWARRLRDLSPGCSCPPQGGSRTDTTRRAALHGQLLVEMLAYSGEPAPTPSPAAVERAHERLKLLQEGAAQVAAAAAEGRPPAADTGPLFPAFAAKADDAPPCFKLGCSLPAEGTGVLERDGLVPLCRRHGSHARAWTEY